MRLTLSQDALQQVANTFADIIQKQITDGIDGNGSPFPGDVTLIKSGDLLRSLQGRVNGEEASVVSELPYAEILEGRFHFAGIAPQYQAELEARLQPIIDEGCELSEV